MAEAIGLTASLLGIAGVGVSIVSTLSKFKILYSTCDQRIEHLSAQVSLTSSILTELGRTIQKHKKGFHLAGQLKLVTEVCREDFTTLANTLLKVKSNQLVDKSQPYWKAPQKVSSWQGKQDSAASSLWKKLQWAMGGSQEVDALMISIESSKSTLQILLESANFFILTELDRKNTLQPNMVEDLREFNKQLPFLIVALRKANIVPWKGKEPSLPTDAESRESRSPTAHIAINSEKDRKGAQEENGPSRTIAPETYEDDCSSSKSQQMNCATDGSPYVVDVDYRGAVEYIGEEKMSKRSSKVGEAQDHEVVVDEMDAPSHLLVQQQAISKQATANFGTTAETKSERGCSLSPSQQNQRKFTELEPISYKEDSTPHEYYEAWLLQWLSPRVTAQTTWTFSGAKISKTKSQPGVYVLEPYPARQTELKAKLSRNHNKDISNSQREGCAMTDLLSLPDEAQFQIHGLIEDRYCVLKPKYQWEISGIIPTIIYMNGSNSHSWIPWNRKISRSQSWIVILKASRSILDGRHAPIRGREPILFSVMDEIDNRDVLRLAEAGPYNASRFRIRRSQPIITNGERNLETSERDRDCNHGGRYRHMPSPVRTHARYRSSSYMRKHDYERERTRVECEGYKPPEEERMSEEARLECKGWKPPDKKERMSEDARLKSMQEKKKQELGRKESLARTALEWKALEVKREEEEYQQRLQHILRKSRTNQTLVDNALKRDKGSESTSELALAGSSNDSVESLQLPSQEEAKQIMEAFLATFTSPDEDMELEDNAARGLQDD